ncbi:nucleotidyltransferase domain-containing protein [Paenibacillus apiarius]|uniref:Nucleotidyltransferase domain-containing protein n=1 Tax=Paenibacillus apiarius TaxID=46240 RepID=A0ABT4E0Y0_9BACL|nr:nucleotidyltransferase domain-containing protein [Paenibacillus apiarius]MCY9517568.1 nucleotidyltransferase domain-containing protein [Paenibacillus apiarius]MCY9522153.1 nucleotidyltransferase domain-containing protein [Paenibacillus apiarius]MCY9552187.1 nucleotidyltransferase domain-containing protein [Paenibacillus apiarius]MCY9560066.1 nucleotidyltransferase domain-containing protein [Paenibacillus apiarius]MCY9683684.1 nucleotidyltransferase domain-containing protein [Paenibacillus a
MSDIKQTIWQELRQIERQEDVCIVYACESGSRAWGFPSQDSDYDVRFLYVRPVDWYLSIFERRDVIERPISNQLDINGWDLLKALRLFRKSNPPLLEWLQSPIQYEETHSVAEQIRSLSPLAFSPRSCMYHYLNMAKGNYREYLQGEQVKIKKYFYVLRPILACGWIEKHNAMPPMEFGVLVRELLPDGSDLREAVDQLLARKMSGEELDCESRIQSINEFIEDRIDYYGRAAVNLKSMEGRQRQDRALDELFRAALREVWAQQKG